jgi:hypothetical protein
MQFAKPDRHVRGYLPYRPSVPEPIRLKIAACAENQNPNISVMKIVTSNANNSESRHGANERPSPVA